MKTGSRLINYCPDNYLLIKWRKGIGLPRNLRKFTKATSIPASPPKMEVYANDKKKITKGYVFLAELFCLKRDLKHLKILFQMFNLNDQTIGYGIIISMDVLIRSGNILFLRDLGGSK